MKLPSYLNLLFLSRCYNYWSNCDNLNFNSEVSNGLHG